MGGWGRGYAAWVAFNASLRCSTVLESAVAGLDSSSWLIRTCLCSVWSAQVRSRPERRLVVRQCCLGPRTHACPLPPPPPPLPPSRVPHRRRDAGGGFGGDRLGDAAVRMAPAGTSVGYCIQMPLTVFASRLGLLETEQLQHLLSLLEFK